MTSTQPDESGLAAAVPPGAAGPCAPGPVVFYRCGGADQPRGHGVATKVAMAKMLAELLGRQFAGEFADSVDAYEHPPYFVPSDTLVLTDDTRKLAILDERHLFGGVVPFPFVATKVITHPLPHPDASAPEGWAPEFPRQVAEVVLPGFSAFSRPDALMAGVLLLEQGPVRVKQPEGIGGVGQAVILDRRELERHLDAADPAELRRHGIVLECNLDDVATLSVGQTRLGDMLITYCGTQRLTRANDGSHVYGGSELLVARGDWSQLLDLDLSPQSRTAIDQARVYHDAAVSIFSGMFASRCNYDIAQGTDAGGTKRSGVLEQSWRIGGASGAEIAALQAFRRLPELRQVHASCTEVYGTDAVPPPGALVSFQGIDPEQGPLLKYTVVHEDA
jgi:hypothetical protein